jgi:hypothetical protein
MIVLAHGEYRKPNLDTICIDSTAYESGRSDHDLAAWYFREW